MSGRAFLVDDTGRIIADGRPDGKKRIARGEGIGGHPLARATTVADARYTRAYDGVEVLAVSTAPLERYGWRVIVEQPTADAFAPASRLEQQLLLFVTLALLANIAIGIAFGRSLLRPISDLLAGIRAIGEGRLDQRVHITRDDEFRLLGDAFNATADKLGELQQAAIRQERQAMFGAYRRRPGARPLAPHPEHQQQLQARAADARRRGVPRDVCQTRQARVLDDSADVRGSAQPGAADPARKIPGGCRKTHA